MTRRDLDRYSTREIQESLLRRQQQERQQRLRRLSKQGRVIDTPGLSADMREGLLPSRSIISTSANETEGDKGSATQGRWRAFFNRSLLLVEIGAVVGFVAIVYGLFSSVQTLNREIVDVQQRVIESAPIPTATIPPVISMVVLPGGHQPPVEGRPIILEEAGHIPEHLLPLVDAYTPPVVPTPSTEQPRQIVINEINVNAPIFQGHEPEQLKKGVGHSIGTAMPGDSGNMVLSAHNDIYGEIFRNLDQLETGDEIVVSTGRESYTYVINSFDVVDPTAVEVMAPTDHASLTLISCYPYLINNKRIIVKADLVES